MILKTNRNGVSPIVATILMVLITLVLAAVLYGGGHGPAYWNYHGAACTLEYDMSFNATEVKAFFENYSFSTGHISTGYAEGSFNRTPEKLVSINIREYETGKTTIELYGYFNDSGRCSFTSESRMDREVAEHYEADNQTFSIEVEYFIQIFHEHFGITPNSSSYYPNAGQSCFRSYD